MHCFGGWRRYIGRRLELLASFFGDYSDAISHVGSSYWLAPSGTSDALSFVGSSCWLAPSGTSDAISYVGSSYWLAPSGTSDAISYVPPRGQWMDYKCRRLCK